MRIDAQNAVSALLGQSKAGSKRVTEREKAEPGDKGKAMPPKVSRDERVNIARNRIQAGYYNSSSVNEAISDRISGIFDQLG